MNIQSPLPPILQVGIPRVMGAGQAPAGSFQICSICLQARANVQTAPSYSGGCVYSLHCNLGDSELSPRCQFKENDSAPVTTLARDGFMVSSVSLGQTWPACVSSIKGMALLAFPHTYPLALDRNEAGGPCPQIFTLCKVWRSCAVRLCQQLS